VDGLGQAALPDRVVGRAEYRAVGGEGGGSPLLRCDLPPIASRDGFPDDDQKTHNQGETAMCQVFAGQDPAGYASINRSVRIAGHSTSIQLEAAFWALLDEIAASQGLSTPKFLSLLHDGALERYGEVTNFASMLRTTCALYLKGHRPTKREVAALHTEAA
jgi:predicted DNA-binding ribbon-helix-helix protein